MESIILFDFVFRPEWGDVTVCTTTNGFNHDVGFSVTSSMMSWASSFSISCQSQSEWYSSFWLCYGRYVLVDVNFTFWFFHYKRCSRASWRFLVDVSGRCCRCYSSLMFFLLLIVHTVRFHVNSFVILLFLGVLSILKARAVSTFLFRCVKYIESEGGL